MRLPPAAALLVVALLPLRLAASPAAPPPLPLTEPTVAAVARAYYGLVPPSRPAVEAFAPTPGLSGRVTDRRGRPVEGAQVVVEPRGGAATPAVETTTDGSGRYAVAPPAGEPGGELTLTVTAPGFARWALATARPADGRLDARLDRALDEPFWTALAAAAEPVERLWLLLEVIGARQMGAPAPTVVYPHVGALRADLGAVARSTAFAPPDDRAFTPRDRALALLAAWGDPADADLVAPYLERTPALRPGPPEAVGPTIDAVCARWADDHFAREKVETRTWHACDVPVTAPDGRHAVAVFRVRYAHWGYSHLLFLRKDDAGWRLHLAGEHEREHYE